MTEKRNRAVMLFLSACTVTGCVDDRERIVYACEEPLEQYLQLARKNIASDYAVERSTEVLAHCPERGYHRRYLFRFDRASMASKQPVEAEIEAIWCADLSSRTAKAELSVSTKMLEFDFTYPWSTDTGKYPKTNFKLNRASLRGGFFNELSWHCELVEQPLPTADD